MNSTYYSHGKLLITGEYAVLDGALSLALPSKYGQSLEVSEQPEANILKWKSLDYKNNIWFETIISVDSLSGQLSVVESTNASKYQEANKTLLSILNAAIQLNSGFINTLNGKQVITNLEFPNNWGLGSSSTFINNVALWANVNSYQLLWKGFTGSGYDIACAQHHTPILYALERPMPRVIPVSFNPLFKDQLFFIHLNKKQNSREGIDRYRARAINRKVLISKINTLTSAIYKAPDLARFEKLIEKHERAIGNALGLTPIKELLFSDYTGVVKSLGAWGGDFVLATGNQEAVNEYFQSKNFSTILAYGDMIL